MKAPICEECESQPEMTPYAYGDISGWHCPYCGWFFDNEEP